MAKHDDDDPFSFEKINDKFVHAFDKVAKKVTDFATGRTEPTPPTTKEFFRAVKANAARDVQKMLEHGFNPNIFNDGGQTPLHLAVISNSLAVAEVLLKHGANPQQGLRDHAQHAPIHDAVVFNRPHMVAFLAHNGGFSQDMVTINGWTLLHRAVEKGNQTIVDTLLKAGIDPNAATDNGSTPLILAVKNGHPDMVRRLLKIPAVAQKINTCHIITDGKRRNALHYAIEKRDLQSIAALVSSGADIEGRDGSGHTPIQTAITTGDHDVVRLVAELGAELNDKGNDFGTALMHTCNTGMNDQRCAEMIHLLVQLGADPDMGDTSVPGRCTAPLHIASSKGGPETMAALLRYPLDKEELNKAEGLSPLMIAIQRADMRKVQMLLNAGANPNRRCEQRCSSPLIEAVRKRNLPMVEALLRAGANPRILDGYGKSALSYAREQGNPGIINHLEVALHKKSPPPAPK